MYLADITVPSQKNHKSITGIRLALKSHRMVFGGHL